MMKHAKMITSPMQTLRRYALPIVLVLSILTLFSSATYAFVTSHTDAIDNKFQLQTINMDLQETTEGDKGQLTSKSDVKIKNTAEATLYVRVKLVLQVLDADGNVIANPVVYNSNGYTSTDGHTYNIYNCIESWDSLMENTDWLQTDNSFVFYYKKPLEAGETTAALLEEVTLSDDFFLYNPRIYPDSNEIPEAERLRVALTVLSEGIQVNGVKGAAGETGVWGDVTVAADGSLIVNNKGGSTT